MWLNTPIIAVFHGIFHFYCCKTKTSTKYLPQKTRKFEPKTNTNIFWFDRFDQLCLYFWEASERRSKNHLLWELLHSFTQNPDFRREIYIWDTHVLHERAGYFRWVLMWYCPWSALQFSQNCKIVCTALCTQKKPFSNWIDAFTLYFYWTFSSMDAV